MILFFVYWRRKIHSPYPWVCPSFCPIVLIIHYFCWLLSFVFLFASQNFNCFLSHINSKWFFSMSLFIEEGQFTTLIHESVPHDSFPCLCLLKDNYIYWMKAESDQMLKMIYREMWIISVSPYIAEHLLDSGRFYYTLTTRYTNIHTGCCLCFFFFNT